MRSSNDHNHSFHIPSVVNFTHTQVNLGEYLLELIPIIPHKLLIRPIITFTLKLTLFLCLTLKQKLAIWGLCTFPFLTKNKNDFFAHANTSRQTQFEHMSKISLNQS